MTLLQVVEQYWWLISFLIANIGGFFVGFNKLQGNVDGLTKRVDRLDTEVTKLSEKANSNDVALAEIRVQLKSVEALLLRLESKIDDLQQPR